MHLSIGSAVPLTISFGFLFACASREAVAQTTIYSDTFSGSPGQLVGSAPETRPGSETWGGSTAIQTTETVAYATNTNPWIYTAWLPLSPATGVTYSLSVTVNTAAAGLYQGGGDWVAVGFGNFATGADMAGRGGPWSLLQNNGGAQFFRADTSVPPAPFLTKSSGTYTPASAHTLRVDFIRAADGSAVASYYIDGSSVTTYNYSSGTAPTITGVGFGTYYQPTTTTFDNFTLTATAVPEPATYAMLAGMGVLGIAALRGWSQRKR